MRHSSIVSACLFASALAFTLVAWPATAQQAPATNEAEQPPATNEAPQPSVQLEQPGGPTQAPVTITLADAIARAQKINAQYLSTVSAAKNAREDALQSRNAMLPQASAVSQYLGTQGNGKISSGRFVTNDGVHVYRAWGVFKQDLSPTTYLGSGYQHSKAAEALANAQAEIAKRGLAVTVTNSYYSLATAQRNYAGAQEALNESQHFLNITRDQEQHGLVAHADVLKAQVQFEQQQQAFDQANLAMEDARLNLAVLLFPTLNENFTVVDDLDTPPALPGFSEMQDMAGKNNPDLHAAMEALREADVDVTSAKGAFLPSFSVEMDYGIEANAFALHSVVSAFPDVGPVPNLGYFVTAGVTIPVFDWGTLRSKLHQSETNREQARVQLSETQRRNLANLYAYYNDASVSRRSMDTARQAADDAAESLRLTLLRYQAGESTATEVVDAENTLIQARTNYSNMELHYRVAIATLQTLTGPF
ncbi:MAG TPA: TolC family protein [Candidatus Acidoferrales bacterium]|nr:TolC family protein [Candidatus Acidoferrales bacterium]